MTFDEIKAKAAKLGTGSKLGMEVDYILDCARVNADDTCYVEKEAPASDYNRIAVETLRDTLSSRETDKAAAAWFKRVGFQW
jgi:hypothetical protein